MGKYKERFENELERMRAFKHKYIVCEFNEEELRKFPHNAKIPNRIKKYIRMNGKYMRKKLYEYEEEYDVPVIFCEDKSEAESKVIEIFQQFVEDDG